MKGPIAAVTAGWEEREDEIDELSEHLGRAVRNLRLHARAEHIFRRDPEFLAAYRRRRSRLRELRELYALRLRHLMETLRELGHRKGSEDLLETEREQALAAVRELDARQLERVDEAHRQFEEDARPGEHDEVVLQRREVAERIGECGAIAFAGGHVAALLHRLLLFEVADLVEDRPVFAWSAGAMCASERVVIYHDSPPEGPGFPQVLERGLGLCPGVVALPHAAQRLRLDDEERVSIFARRFAPRHCVALDDASGLLWDGKGWELLGDGARRLTPAGQVVAMREIEAA